AGQVLGESRRRHSRLGEVPPARNECGRRRTELAHTAAGAPLLLVVLILAPPFFPFGLTGKVNIIFASESAAAASGGMRELPLATMMHSIWRPDACSGYSAANWSMSASTAARAEFIRGFFLDNIYHLSSPTRRRRSR